MEKYGEYKQIKAANSAARYVLSLIGRAQKTTSKDVGKLHKASVSITIQYQERDGAKNYHEDKRLNAAFSQAVTEVFPELQRRVINIIGNEEDNALAACKYEVTEILKKIKELGG